MDKKEKKHSVSIRIPESKHVELKEIAEKPGQTLTNVILNLLEAGTFICFEEGTEIAKLLFELRRDVQNSCSSEMIIPVLNRLGMLMDAMFKKYDKKGD